MFDQSHSRRHRRPAPTGEHLATPSAAGDALHAPSPGSRDVLQGHPGPHGDGDGPRYVLLRATDGGLYLWCPVDSDPRTGAPIRQLIPVVPVAADARSLSGSVGGEDGELAVLRRQVGELGLQVAALREQLARLGAMLGLSPPAEAHAARAHDVRGPGHHDVFNPHGASAPEGRSDGRRPDVHALMGEPVDPRVLASLLLQGKLPVEPRR